MRTPIERRVPAPARGVDVVNHSAVALALHAANHPETIPLWEDVDEVDRFGHRRGTIVAFAFSPHCKHFSFASSAAAGSACDVP